VTDRSEVYAAIDRERLHQQRKWHDRPHSAGAWLTVLRCELREAEEAWAKRPDDPDCLREILQVAAVAVAALEQLDVAERDHLEKS
jgi:hypothetical protein